MAERTIKVVVIDPYAGAVYEKEVEASLASYYETIGHGCRLIEAAYAEALDDECVYVDEEGLFQQKAGFQLRGHHQPLLGRGIVIGTDNQGRSVSTKFTAREVRAVLESWVFVPQDRENEDD